LAIGVTFAVNSGRITDKVQLGGTLAKGISCGFFSPEYCLSELRRHRQRGSADMTAQRPPRFQLPAAEDELWRQVVIRLLEQRDVSVASADDCLRLLEEMAFHAKLCGALLTRASVINTASRLATQKQYTGPGDKAKQWLDNLQQWELLVPARSAESNLEFGLPGLEEYFCALHMAHRWIEEDEPYVAWITSRTRSDKVGDNNLQFQCPVCKGCLRPFSHYFWHSEWHELILLVAGMMKDATPTSCQTAGRVR